MSQLPLPPPPQPPPQQPPTTPRPSGGFIAAMVISGLFVGLFVVGSVIGAVDRDNATGSGSSASPSVPVSTSTMTVTAEPTVDPTEPANVTRVIDGDTIEVALDNEIVTVRLIGIDTPETVHPTEPVGCYGHAASRFTTSALQGRAVRLEFDVERLDQYDRTLAYVWLGDELFNETLVAEGFAVVDTFPPNVKYVERFLAAQRDARSHERGLWGAVCNQPKPEPVNTGGGGGGKCDPSYPDVCIPPYPPDLDCDDVPFSFFKVEPPDPHDFDSDDDADLIGCES